MKAIDLLTWIEENLSKNELKSLDVIVYNSSGDFSSEVENLHKEIEEEKLYIQV